MPGCPAAQSDALVELQDIGPTILELAGLEPGYSQCGLSFAGLIGNTGDQSHTHRPVIFSEYDREIMAYDGRWKLVVNQQSEPCLLFDLGTDPAESRNLAGCKEWQAEETRLAFEISRFLSRNRPVVSP